MRWFAATLLALLALAYSLIVFASPSKEVHPDPHDRGLGGLSTFAKALQDSGYRVAFDGSTRPRLAKGDVAIVPVLNDRLTPKEVLSLVEQGTGALVLNVPTELHPVTEPIEIQDFRGMPATVDYVRDVENPIDGWPSVSQVKLWTDEGDEVATFDQVGKGRIARLHDGVLATNRFLSRHDNAKVVLSTLLPVAPKGSRLVFVAGGYGEATAPGPIESVGPWAVGSVWQILGLLAAFGVVRGIRFGLPVPEARQRRGARELLDAVAGHYRRARRTDAPLLAAARERPDDATIQSLAIRKKVPEAEARRALIELESRPKARR